MRVTSPSPRSIGTSSTKVDGWVRQASESRPGVTRPHAGQGTDNLHDHIRSGAARPRAAFSDRLDDDCEAPPPVPELQRSILARRDQDDLPTMPSNLFHAPIHDVIGCQNGSPFGILGSDPATPGELPENIHVFMTNFQDQRAEEVEV